MPTAFIHIGLMKTGTTSIQMTLFNNAERLRAERRLCYPTMSANHWPGLLPFLRQDHFQPQTNFLLRGRGSRRNLWRQASAFRQQVNLAAENEESLIISSEHLPMLEASSLRAFRAFLTELKFVPRIIAYVRHPLDRLSSQLSQRVGGGHDSLKTFRWVDDVVPTLILFSEVFGRENLMVRRFDGTQVSRGDLVADFMTAIGQPPLSGVTSPRLNGRLSAPAMALADRLFELAPLASGRRGTDRYFAEIAGPAFQVTRALATRTLEEATPSLVYLEREFGISFQSIDLNEFPETGPAFTTGDLPALATVLQAQSRTIADLTSERDRLRRRAPMAGLSRRLTRVVGRLRTMMIGPAS